MSSRPRSLLRTLADTMVFITLLGLLLLALRQTGWLAPAQGTFIAIDGDSLRKGDNEYRMHAINAPELHQTCKSASGANYPCGHDAQKALRALVAGKSL